MSDEEQMDRLLTALQDAGVPHPFNTATALFNRGVRVLQLDETILNRSDAKLLDHVRQAAERWNRLMTRAAEVRPDSSERTSDVKELDKKALIMSALIGAGQPLTRVQAIQVAAGWHRDYAPSPTEWDPWRAAWRELLIQCQVVRSTLFDLGEESLWEPVTPNREPWVATTRTERGSALSNDPEAIEERRRQNPGLCVTAVMVGPTAAQGSVICGVPEQHLGSGVCREHTL